MKLEYAFWIGFADAHSVNSCLQTSQYSKFSGCRRLRHRRVLAGNVRGPTPQPAHQLRAKTTLRRCAGAWLGARVGRAKRGRAGEEARGGRRGARAKGLRRMTDDGGRWDCPSDFAKLAKQRRRPAWEAGENEPPAGGRGLPPVRKASQPAKRSATFSQRTTFHQAVR